MAFGLNMRLNTLERQVETWRADAMAGFGRLGEEVETGLDALRGRADAFRADLAAVDAGATLAAAFRDALAESGLPGFDRTPLIRSLNDLPALVGQLPPELQRPDATGEVPTGSAAVTRAEALEGATLAAAARIVRALGPDAAVVEAAGESYAVSGRYEDPVSGFAAVRLTSLLDGTEVFSIDGLEIGSRADATAAATLGRLQVESAAFRAMVEDAARLGAEPGADLLFTGPSLGGVGAQVGAYETAEALVALGVAPGTVRLVTVDPLGGADAARAINGGVLDPGALALIEALNLRTEGDLISRIGSHIGATKTLPALDEAGNETVFDPATAHVNVASLLQALSSDAVYDAAPLGAPAEIGGFAMASNAASDALIDAWLATAEAETGPPRSLQIPGEASLDPTRTRWSLDVDANGTVDIAVQLASPLDPARDDLVLV
jgi:hypothetical protein